MMIAYFIVCQKHECCVYAYELKSVTTVWVIQRNRIAHNSIIMSWQSVITELPSADTTHFKSGFQHIEEHWKIRWLHLMG